MMGTAFELRVQSHAGPALSNSGADFHTCPSAYLGLFKLLSDLPVRQSYIKW